MKVLQFMRGPKLAFVQWGKPLSVQAMPEPIRVVVPTDKVVEAQLAFKRGGSRGLREVAGLTQHLKVQRPLEDVFEWDLVRWKAQLAAEIGEAASPKPKKLRPLSSMHDYQEWLAKRGFRQIGGGYYGSVWGKDGSPWVIKMGNQKDDGWPAYAALVMEKHATNPFAPRIKNLRWHTKGKAFYVAVMERLDRTVFDLGFAEQDQTLRKMYRYAYEASLARRGRGTLSLALIQRRHPELYRLVQDIRRDLLPGSDLDLHDRNAMVDEKHTRMVITDPIGSTTINTRTGTSKRRAIAA